MTGPIADAQRLLGAAVVAQVQAQARRDLDTHPLSPAQTALLVGLMNRTAPEQPSAEQPATRSAA